MKNPAQTTKAIVCASLFYPPEYFTKLCRYGLALCRVLSPSKTAQLSNGSCCVYRRARVLSPSKTTQLSNHVMGGQRLAQVLSPSKTTQLSNYEGDTASSVTVLSPSKTTQLSNHPRVLPIAAGVLSPSKTTQLSNLKSRDGATTQRCVVLEAVSILHDLIAGIKRQFA